MMSALGAPADPIADKLRMRGSYLFLAIPSFPAAVKVPVWLAVLVISRDILLMTVGLLMILSSGARQFPPTWLGKVTTVTLILTVLIVLCANLWSWPMPLVWVAFVGAPTTTVLPRFHDAYRVSM